MESDLAVALQRLNELQAEQEKERMAQSTAYHLYIGCHPHNYENVVYCDVLISEYQEKVAENRAVPYYGLLEYGEGPKQVAALLRADLMTGNRALPEVLIIDRRNPCADAVLDVIIPMYRKLGNITQRIG